MGYCPRTLTSKAVSTTSLLGSARKKLMGYKFTRGVRKDLRNDHSSPSKLWMVLGGMAQKSFGESVSGYSNPACLFFFPIFVP